MQTLDKLYQRSCFVLLAMSLWWFSAAAVAGAAGDAERLRLDWSGVADRVWAGPELWVNRLQDWRVADERLELDYAGGVKGARTAHLLTRRLSDRPAPFSMRVRLGAADGGWPAGGAVGFLVGAGGGEMDPRGASIVQWAGEGAGWLVGVDAAGGVLVHDYRRPWKAGQPTEGKRPAGPIVLHLAARPDGDGFLLDVEARDEASGEVLGVAQRSVPADTLVGNVALAVQSGNAAAGVWFDGWVVEGAKFDATPANRFGPITSFQYTLSGGVLKLTAQLMPVSTRGDAAVELQRQTPAGWEPVGHARVITPGYTATFRVPQWDDTQAWPIRLVYADSDFGGTVHAEPDADTLTLAVVNCIHQNSFRLSGADWGGAQGPANNWLEGLWFPHNDLVERIAHHDPDMLFFAGDQLYESASPTPTDKQNLELDYLYRWYLFCWTFRDLTSDRPAVTIPDDHDIYQGNLWGAGGRKAERDTDGGYVNPAWFVKMVERTQTSHLPDPFDPTPVEQGIGVYYTAMTYGGVGFAVLEDRKFKSGVRDPVTDEWADSRDPERKLLGERQLAFLDAWARDWEGQDLKAVLSQTVFAQAATHSGPKLRRGARDIDANGIFKPARDRAVRAIRKSFAVHICGDQHLTTLLKHGVGEYGDSFWSFCGPAAANFWPRAWAPKAEGEYELPARDEDYLGDHLDGMGNMITMFAAGNPWGLSTGLEPADLYDRVPGYGIVRFHRHKQEVTFESWPRHADPRNDAEQFPNWPRTVTLGDNYARRPVAYLPEIRVRNTDPAGAGRGAVIRVTDAAGGLVYARRFRGGTFRPGVFAQGDYTVEVGVPEQGVWRSFGVSADGSAEPIEVDLSPTP